MSGPTGWIPRPAAVAAYLAERARTGSPCGFDVARPELKDFWRQTVLGGQFAVLLYEAEHTVLGEYLPADAQQRGTCVSRGTYRAVQTSYWDAIANRRVLGRAERIAYEPIYAGSRVNIGRGQLGRSDGSVGVWAAQWVHEFGVIPRQRYDDVDFTHDREDWAVQHGEPNRGVPASLAVHGRGHECDAYHVADAHDLADVIAARSAAAICSTHQQTNRRDEQGECGYLGPTAHCEAIVGVYLRTSWDGRPESIYDHTGFVDQQSWGLVPDGPDVLRFHHGTAKLREGAYGTPMPAMRRRLLTGETWAFRLRDGWRDDTLQEMLR